MPVCDLLTIESLSAQPNRFGLPACDAPDQQLATRIAFTTCHSNTHRVPLWAAHQLTPEMLTTAAPRRHFRRDPELPRLPARILLPLQRRPSTPRVESVRLAQNRE
ncbi:MAG: DNA/RNA non-specific endonuclease [Acidobacteria bacterium]|nr:DNA/RNA non-specific endonuclease [Acidobacteriota bacterium]